MSAMDWFDQTTSLFANVIPPMIMLSESGWVDWAENARTYQAQIPDPGQFNNWRDWADRFNQVMYVVKQ